MRTDLPERKTLPLRIPLFLFSALLIVVTTPRVTAQVVPPVGPGVCVAFCGGGGGVPGMGGGFSPGGMMGGVAAAIIGSMIMSAVAAEMQKQSVAAPGQQSQGSSRFPYQRTHTYQASDPVQEALEQQRRFQEERERRVLQSMIDSPSFQLADSTTKMDFLSGSDEEAWFKAGCYFDRGNCSDPGSLWHSLHDGWFSTKPVGIQQADGVRPLEVNEKPMEITGDQFQPLRCTGPVGPYGGQLCSFPQPKGPVISLEKISMVPTRPPSSPPAPSPLTGSAPSPVDTTVMGIGGAATAPLTPKSEPRGAPGHPIGERSTPLEPRDVLAQHVDDLRKTCRSFQRKYDTYSEVRSKYVRGLIDPALAEQEAYREIGSTWWKEYLGIAEGMTNSVIDGYIKAQGYDQYIAVEGAQNLRDLRKLPGDLTDVIVYSSSGTSEIEKKYGPVIGVKEAEKLSLDDAYSKGLSILDTAVGIAEKGGLAVGKAGTPVKIVTTGYSAYRGTSFLQLYITALKNQRALAEARSMKEHVEWNLGVLGVQKRACSQRLSDAETELANYGKRMQVRP